MRRISSYEKEKNLFSQSGYRQVPSAPAFATVLKTEKSREKGGELNIHYIGLTRGLNRDELIFAPRKSDEGF